MGRHVVSVTGVVAHGRHGANPGEQEQPQEFRVDLEVEVEVGADSLSATVDYRLLAEMARRTVEETSFNLLESMAQAVVHVLRSVPSVVAARATVHKPSAAQSMGVDDVAATASSSDRPGDHVTG